MSFPAKDVSHFCSGLQQRVTFCASEIVQISLPHEATLRPMFTPDVLGSQATTGHTSTSASYDWFMRHVVRRNLILGRLIRPPLCFHHMRLFMFIRHIVVFLELQHQTCLGIELSSHGLLPFWTGRMPQSTSHTPFCLTNFIGMSDSLCATLLTSMPPTLSNIIW